VSSLDVRSIDDNQLRKQPCPATRQAFRVFVSEAAFDRAVARGDGDTTREIGGVLVGELLRDDAGPYLWIDATIDALHAEEKGAELTFTHATWDHIHQEMDSRHPKKRVVGWYHTHPGFGVFLSDRDQFIHKSFFNLPFQVAFVYDPKSHEHGMFTWQDNEVWRARRYWIGPHEQVWDGARTPADKPGRDQPEHDPHKPLPPDRHDRGGELVQPQDHGSQPGTLGMLIVVGLMLLLIGGGVGHWLGARSANDVLARAEVEIVKARSEGAQRTLASLSSDLVGILRDTLGDEALRRPLIQAVGILDQIIQIIAALPADTAGSPPAGSRPAGAGSGSAAASGSATALAASGATPPGAGNADPRWAALATQLKAARAGLLQLEQARGSAQAVLTRLEQAARRDHELPKQITRELAGQRSGLGAVYAELATEAVKAGDRARARRLLSTAAHLDPGNRVRYEKQLQSFDPSGRLPPDSIDSTGSAGQGAQR
jgi:proteasome lid subunit RPN8/RPN11